MKSCQLLVQARQFHADETPVVRSWDQRLKGADVRNLSGGGAGLQDVPVVRADGAPAKIERRRRSTDSPTDAIKQDTAREIEQALDKIDTENVSPAISIGTSNNPTLESILMGVQAAVDAAELALLVADRETGSVLWSSKLWRSRFGERRDFARYLPSTTELGEAPLPPAGTRWNRTRSMLAADESEVLCDLTMVGLPGPRETELVSIIATNRAANAPRINDRSEVVSVIDGSIAAASSGGVGVLFIDLDRYKVVEDRLGPVDATALLNRISEKLGGTVRGTDLLFRMSSDEFVIVACELEDEHIAEELAEKIRAEIATLAGVPQDLAITASIGVAVVRDNQGGDLVLSSAEAAMFEAKTKGRNRVAVHDSESRSRSERQKVAERKLREAIERRQIQFNYQPVVEMGTGRVVGAEALLRFGGDVSLSAAEVVAAAEHGGLMGTLGITVVDGVAEELGTWLKDPELEQVIMINLSASQLEDPALLDRLKAVATEGYPDRRLAIEVPEVVVRSNRKAYLALNRALAGTFLMGIDGFGTNESSVEMLTGLPLDYIKLHRAVTAGITSGDDTMAPLKSLLGRAEESGIMVVALGVESRTQAERLQGLSCPLGQGFLYASAVNAKKLMDLSTSGFAGAQSTK